MKRLCPRALTGGFCLVAIILATFVPAISGGQVILTAVHDSRVGSPDNAITLWKWNGLALCESRSGYGGGNWSPWQLLKAVNTSTIPTVMLGWYDGNRRINGEFWADFWTGQLFTPWEVNTTFNWGSMSSPFLHYTPETGFTWQQGTTNRLNIFGTAYVDSQTGFSRLVEHWWDGTTWRWTDHGQPPNASTDFASGYGIMMGPESAVWNTASGEGFVFMPAPDAISCRYWNGAQWSWVYLGHPENVDQFTGPPVAITWTSSRSGASYTTVFIVGYSRANGSYLLYERDWSHSQGQWSGWIAHNPPLRWFSVAGGFQFPFWMGWVHFYLTSGIKWAQSTPNGPVDRFNLFGTAASFASPAGQQPGSLVEFYFDGSNWQWGAYDTPPGLAAGQNFQSQTAVALDRNGNQYFAVYGTTVDSLGNWLGTVWERFFTINQGVPSGWFWRDLTF